MDILKILKLKWNKFLEVEHLNQMLDLKLLNLKGEIENFQIKSLKFSGVKNKIEH